MVLYKAVAAWPLAFSHTTFPDSVIFAAAQCCVACVSVIISIIPTVWCHLYASLAAAETHPWHLPQLAITCSGFLGFFFCPNVLCGYGVLISFCVNVHFLLFQIQMCRIWGFLLSTPSFSRWWQQITILPGFPPFLSSSSSLRSQSLRYVHVYVQITLFWLLICSCASGAGVCV